MPAIAGENRRDQFVDIDAFVLGADVEPGLGGSLRGRERRGEPWHAICRPIAEQQNLRQLGDAARTSLARPRSRRAA